MYIYMKKQLPHRSFLTVCNLLIGLLKSSFANYSWLYCPDGCQELFLINVNINQLPNINFDVSYEEIV